ncbi:MAG: phosphatase PAP2 family protein [Arcobacteraceae bacterium]
MTIRRQLFYSIISLLLVILLFGLTNLDLYIQDLFYVFDTNTWILSRDAQPWKFIFYDGIKRLLICIALIFLFILIFFRNHKRIVAYKKGILLVVLSSIFIPLLVGGLKKSTNMPCPKNEMQYAGEIPRTAVWEKYIEPYKSIDKIACWPAGHASGGFALLSFFFLFKTKRNKLISLFIALSIGWSMGIYKMLIGDHFLSHTLITMNISWICILGIYTIISKEIN